MLHTGPLKGKFETFCAIVWYEPKTRVLIWGDGALLLVTCQKLAKVTGLKVVTAFCFVMTGKLSASHILWDFCCPMSEPQKSSSFQLLLCKWSTCPDTSARHWVFSWEWVWINHTRTQRIIFHSVLQHGPADYCVSGREMTVASFLQTKQMSSNL